MVYAITPDSPIGEGGIAGVSGLKSFREYAIARQQVGRPVAELPRGNGELPRLVPVVNGTWRLG